MPGKACNKCGKIKPLADFYKHPNAADGHLNACKDCKRGCQAAYRETNPEKVSDSQRRYRAANLDHLRREYKLWWARTRDIRLAYSRRYYQENRSQMLAGMAEWRAANPERHRELAQEWAARNPERKAANDFARRRRKINAKQGDTRAIARFVTFVRSAPRLRCYWCGKGTRANNRHIDHIIPLDAGGAHAVENLCCSCPSCNLSKGRKMPIDFAGQGEIPFGLVA